MFKKGQITLFIIMGIVLIAGVGTVIYIRSISEKETFEEIPAGREVKYEGEQEIIRFVDSCLKPVVLQGLEIMRLQGGYIDNNQPYYRLLVKDREGKEQVKLIDGSKRVVKGGVLDGNEIPFWVTDRGIAIPSKELLEEELETYVARELDKCVGDFKQFADMGFLIRKGNINVDVSYAKSVWIDVEFPLDVTVRDINYQIDRFNLEVPINMELIYNMASDLALYEATYAYLEHHSLDLIEKYSFRGGSKSQPTMLPPKRFTDTNFGCDSESWTLKEVKNDLKNVFTQNVPYLHIAGTKFQREMADPNLPPEQKEIVQGTFDSYIHDFFEQEYPSVQIRYMYDPEWKLLLDILPKSGSTIKPDKTVSAGIPMVPRLCVFKYRFNYFIDYPVLMKVKDLSSARIDPISNTLIQKGGFELFVPLWVFICGNQKRECKGRVETYDISTEGQTYFCDPTQRLSGDIKIAVVDADSTKPLDKVDVYYYGGNTMNNCFIGRTDSNGQLTSKFPLCSGCQIDLYRHGYANKRETFTVMDKQDKDAAFALDPFFELDVEVRLIRIPVFVRSWHKTDGFKDVGKMINLSYSYGYDTSEVKDAATDLGLDVSNLPVITAASGDLNSLLEELRNSDEFKAMIPTLLGETAMNTDHDDRTMITGTGLEQFNYMSPDPYDAKLKLGAGDYNVNLVTTANVDIKDTVYEYEEDDETEKVTVKGFRNISGLGSTNYDWHITTDDIKGKSLITFYSLVEHTSAELNPGNWKMIDDPIMQDGTMKAAVTITKEEYLPYILPKLS